MKERPYSGILSGLILFCFFLSGMTGLIYEILWSRMIVPIVGCAPFAVSIILTVFMGGLGLGSYIAGRTVDRVKNPARLVVLYAWLEILIGLYALSVPFLVRLFEPLYAMLYNRFFEHFLFFNFLTFVVCSALLCVPVIAMGATLPILCRFYVNRLSSLGTRAGRLYGLNTIGAALGSMLCGFWLLSAFGIAGTLGLAVSANLTIGVVCLAAARMAGRMLQPVQGRKNRTSVATLVETSDGGDTAEFSGVRVAVVGSLVIFAVSGFCAMGYEVIWTNLLGLLVGPTTYSFTIILATFISCLALGSLFFGWLGDRTKKPVTILVFTQVFAAVLALVSSQVLGNGQLFFSKVIYHARDNFVLLHGLKIFLLFVFMLPPCVCLGATFPLVGKIYTKNIQAIGRSIGFAYVINTIGAVLGSFCAGFLLLPFLGKANSIRLVVALQLVTATVVAGVLFFRSRRMPVRGIAVFVLAGAGAILCWYWPHWSVYTLAEGKYHRFYNTRVNYDGLGWGRALLEGTSILEKMQEDELVYTGDGIGGFTCVTEKTDGLGSVNYSLLISGKADASSKEDMGTQTLLAHLPLLFHPRPRNVMILGLASGVTAGEALCYPVDNVDILEINQQVVKASDFFAPWNNRVLQDPRTHLIVQDARAHLQLTQRSYDVIISEPSNPWMAGLAALFTCDYYEAVHQRLADDGIFVQFFHSYEMDWQTFSLIGRSFASVFPNSALFATHPSGYGYDYLMLGFKGTQGLSAATAEKNLAYAQKSPNIRLSDSRFFYRMLVTEKLPELFGTGRLNTDWRPILEFAAPKRMYDQESRDASIRDNLRMRSVLLPETSRIIKELTDSVDLQIDYVDYAMSVHSPFANMVDLSKATEEQKQRFIAILEEYYRHNVLKTADSGAINDPQILRRCREVIIDTIQQKIDSSPRPGISYTAMGDQYSLLKRYDEASKAYQKALTYVENEYLYNNYGNTVALSGKLEEAEKIFETALVKEPDSSILYRSLAKLYDGTERSEEAISYYKKALDLKPSNAGAARELAVIYTKRQRFEEAIELFRTSLTVRPNHAGTYNDLAIAYIQTDQKLQAVECLARALSLQRDHPRSFGHLRRLVLNLPPDEAIRLSKTASEITKNQHAGILSTLSIAYAKANRFQEAIATAEMALPLAQQSGDQELIKEIQDNLNRPIPRTP